MQSNKYTFKQLAPPALYQIIKINYPPHEFLKEHWKHQITAIQIEKKNSEKIILNTYVFFKNQGGVTLLNFQDNCLFYQKTFKIGYAQCQEITCLKVCFEKIQSELKGAKEKRQCLLLIGYDDSCIEIYHLSTKQNIVSLRKLLVFGQTLKSQEIVDLQMDGEHLYACRTHSASVYLKCLSLVTEVLLQEDESPKRKPNFKCKMEDFALSELSSSGSLSMTIGLNYIYFYHEINGTMYFDKETFQIVGEIVDTILVLKETGDENLVIGDSNDKIKIIYKQTNFIAKYRGLKSFPSSIHNIMFDHHEQLWIADMSGSLTFLIKQIDPISIKNSKTLPYQIQEYEFTQSSAIGQNGIKNLIVLKNMVIVLDCEGCMIFYDAGRAEKTSTDRYSHIEM